MQHGFPPALIRKRDRLRYISSLEKAQLGGSKESYHKIIVEAIDRSLDIYFAPDMIDTVKRIRTLQKKRLTLKEIKEKFEG
jgi:hypothetical protein